MECLYSTFKLRAVLLVLLFVLIVIGHDTNNDQDEEDEDKSFIHGRIYNPRNTLKAIDQYWDHAGVENSDFRADIEGVAFPKLRKIFALFIPFDIIYHRDLTGLDALQNIMDPRVRCGKVKIDLTEFAKFYKRDTEEDSSEETFDTATDEDKLIGGNLVIYGEAPWISTIYIDKNLSCTTVIVNEFWILATGSCFYPYHVKDIKVKVADMHRTIVEGDERTFDLERIILYPGYRLSNNEYNIALAKIKPRDDGSGIQFNEYVQPICLPETGEYVSLHDRMTVYSWGYESIYPIKLENIVKKADLEVVDESDCKRAFPYAAMKHSICVGNSSWIPKFCKADASAPAFGKKENSCWKPATPLLMTSVRSHREWIDSTILAYSTGDQGVIPRRPSRRHRIRPK